MPAGELSMQAVAILIRHGDRSPINLWRTYHNETKHKLCKTTNQDLISTVSTLNNVFYKSSPQSLKNYSWYPNKEKCSSVELTSKGSEQLFKLGKIFNKKYRNLFDYVIKSGKKRLSDSQSKNILGDGGYIYLRTTEYERTFQSGIAFLAGLLSEFIENFSRDTSSNKDLQMDEFLKDIVTITSTQNIWQCSHHMYSSHGMEPPPCFCQKAGSMMRQKDLKRYNSSELEILARGRVSVTTFYGSFTSLGGAAESIASYICNGVNLPCFPTILKYSGTPSCMEWNDVSNVLAAIKVVEEANYADPRLMVLDKLHIYPFFWELWFKFSLSTLYGRDSDDKKPSFLIYPSHDSTILAFLQILGLDRNLWWPALSSSVIIELHSLREKQFFIRVFHDGVDVTNSLPFCRDRFALGENMCYFENFSFYVLKQLQSSFNNKTYAEFCEH